jgi:hypothetical protein
LNELPLKSVANASVLVRDIGRAGVAGTIQNNIVCIDGQKSGAAFFGSLGLLQEALSPWSQAGNSRDAAFNIVICKLLR